MPRSPLKPKNNSRIAAQRGGHFGEALAAFFLQVQFYKILDRRFKTPVGEIDLVAQRFGMTVFVEVKMRRDRTLFAPTMDAVNQRRIGRAAQY